MVSVASGRVVAGTRHPLVLLLWRLVHATLRQVNIVETMQARQGALRRQDRRLLAVAADHFVGCHRLILLLIQRNQIPVVSTSIPLLSLVRVALSGDFSLRIVSPRPVDAGQLLRALVRCIHVHRPELILWRPKVVENALDIRVGGHSVVC